LGKGVLQLQKFIRNVKFVSRNIKAQKSYDDLRNCIRGLYPEGLSEQEADEATRNFIGFGKLLLEMKCEQERKKQADSAAADLSESA